MSPLPPVCKGRIHTPYSPLNRGEELEMVQNYPAEGGINRGEEFRVISSELSRKLRDCHAPTIKSGSLAMTKKEGFFSILQVAGPQIAGEAISLLI